MSTLTNKSDFSGLVGNQVPKFTLAPLEILRLLAGADFTATFLIFLFFLWPLQSSLHQIHLFQPAGIFPPF